MARGGKRAGSGRPSKARNKKTEYMLLVKDKALAEGITPLEYLLRTMREAIPEKATVGQRLELKKIRLECAKAAAPYCHPRIAPKEEGAGGSGKTPTEHADKIRETVREMDRLTGGAAP